jgi:RHS repeat-associated protein
MRGGSGGLRYYHRNQQYSITAVSDGGGSVVERYAYNANGQVTIADASGSVISVSAISNHYTYTGREWDEGLSLYHYRARMYDAMGGRFIARDPIGFTDSKSLYRQYFQLTGVDPSGLKTRNDAIEVLTYNHGFFGSCGDFRTDVRVSINNLGDADNDTASYIVMQKLCIEVNTIACSPANSSCSECKVIGPDEKNSGGCCFYEYFGFVSLSHGRPEIVTQQGPVDLVDTREFKNSRQGKCMSKGAGSFSSEFHLIKVTNNMLPEVRRLHDAPYGQISDCGGLPNQTSPMLPEAPSWWPAHDLNNVPAISTASWDWDCCNKEGIDIHNWSVSDPVLGMR